jgi:hypothetical protein
LAADVCGEDLGDVEELRGVDEGAPEGGDEEKDEEDCGVLASAIRCADKRSLQGDFADQTDEDAGEADEEECAAAEAFDDWVDGFSLGCIVRLRRGGFFGGLQKAQKILPGNVLVTHREVRSRGR